MKEKVNIICLYWVGNFRGRKFTHDHIIRLFQSVRKHIDREFDFWVLTNDNQLINSCPLIEWSTTSSDYTDWKIIPLKYAWPGWWSKTELHRPDLKEILGGRRTLYMDLDSHVVSSLQPMLDYLGDLVMFPTGIPERKWKSMRKRGWVCKYQAATMLFNPGCKPMQEVWHSFMEAPHLCMKHYRSEQDVMGEWIPNQPMMPREWYCKLESVQKLKHIPKDAIIVTGQPADGSFYDVHKLNWFEEIAR